MSKMEKSIKKQLKMESEYSDAVQRYLYENSERFLGEFSELCIRTNGRILYEDIKYILGRDYPKASWINPSDYKAQIRQFFREINIMFKADETHLYFP